MSIVLFGRVASVVLSVATFVFLFLHDSWHSDNLFLIPDLILCAVLFAGALVPSARVATVAMTVGLALAGGVFITSVSSYAVRDEFGGASLVGAVAALATAVALAAQASRQVVRVPADQR